MVEKIGRWQIVTVISAMFIALIMGMAFFGCGSPEKPKELPKETPGKFVNQHKIVIRPIDLEKKHMVLELDTKMPQSLWESLVTHGAKNWMFEGTFISCDGSIIVLNVMNEPQSVGVPFSDVIGYRLVP
jgi:hypothetical protein